MLLSMDTTLEMKKVSRELMVVEEMLARQVPYRHNAGKKFETNTNVGTDFALLFAMTKDYRLKDGIYTPRKAQNTELEFEVPQYLLNGFQILKVSESGVSEIQDYTIDGSLITIPCILNDTA
ncbi:MAG: hypothetical protein EOM23_11830 [Candidatus Moranbacteria bacterium]|nr:hypothetical protein [Candidatus Moranbacteria bacterium]